MEMSLSPGEQVPGLIFELDPADESLDRFRLCFFTSFFLVGFLCVAFRFFKLLINW